MRCCPMARGCLCLGHTMQMSSLASGFSRTSSTRMVHWNAAKQGGLSVDFPCAPASTSTRPPRWSNRAPSSRSCTLLRRTGGHWPVHQLDVKNTFLHDNLLERVYCHQPVGFVDVTHATCMVPAPRCTSPLYRLRHYRLRLLSLRFQRGSDIAYILVYVNDIILTASLPALLHHIIEQLHHAFAIKDLGALRFFLGVQVRRDDRRSFLT